MIASRNNRVKLNRRLIPGRVFLFLSDFDLGNKLLVMLFTLILPMQSAKSAVLELLPETQVDLQGIFLKQLVKPSSAATAAVQLAPAPAWGEIQVLTREKVAELISKAMPNAEIELDGASEISISRESTQFEEKQLLELLTQELQPSDTAVKTGELELQLGRPWKPITVPVEPIELKIIDKPNYGLSPSFSVKFQLISAGDPIGTYFISVRAQLFREVWVARTAVRRLTNLADADLIRERRDIINVRQALWESDSLDSTMHLVEPISAGGLLYARSIRQQPVIRRGQIIPAYVSEGLLSFRVRLEALEDGAPEEIIRARNPQTKKEIRVKVINEDTLQLMF